MWTWSLNWGQITPQIIIGTCPMIPDDLNRIKTRAAATALLSLQHDDCLAYWSIDQSAMDSRAAALGLTTMRCPIRDFDITDMRRQLPKAVSMLARLIAAGHRAYVHCTAGLGRAPLTVLGYLALIEHLDPDDAIRLILKGRPDAVPAWEAYRGARADLVARNHGTIERRAYDLYEKDIMGNADTHWHQAEAEILHAVLAQGTSEKQRLPEQP